jgi:hypothetical protein
MKKLVISIIISLFSVSSFAQAIVLDVQRNLALETLLDQKAIAMSSESLMQSKLAEMEMLDKLKMSVEFLQMLNSLRILYGLVQQLVCQIDGLYIAMNNYRFEEKNCLFKMKIEVVFMKLDLATDVLDIAGSTKSIFSDKFSSYDRIGMMNKASQTIMDTSRLLEELKTLINRQNTVYLNSAYSKLRTKNNYSSWNLNRYRP